MTFIKKKMGYGVINAKNLVSMKNRNNQKVYQLDLKHKEVIATFDSVTDCHKKLGIPQTSVSNTIRLGRTYKGLYYLSKHPGETNEANIDAKNKNKREYVDRGARSENFVMNIF